MYNAAEEQCGGFEASDRSASHVAALLMRHHAFLKGYLHSVVRNLSDAEDLLQEVSMAAIESAHRFRRDMSFPAWIRGIARHFILQRVRESRRAPLALSEKALEQIEQATADLEQGETLDRRMAALRECLKTLGGVTRKVVDLRYGGNRDATEIAQSVGRTLATTYNILNRARQALRRCMERRIADSVTGGDR